MDKKITLSKPEVVINAVEGWNVEQFTDDGACLMAIFTGPYAEQRARSYTALGAVSSGFLNGLTGMEA